jgi:pimeloyl-ACP methyl ester carboxylesterase
VQECLQTERRGNRAYLLRRQEISPALSMEVATRIAGVVLVLLGAATLLAYALQRSLIYYPSHARLDTLESLATREGLLSWRNNDQRFIGWRTQDGRGFPVLILHGNAGHAFHRSHVVSRLRKAGITSPIYILEYPGYGAREGAPTENSLVTAALEAIDLLPRRIVLLGESLGSGVACQAAARRRESVAGLVLLTPFDSLMTVARKHYPVVPSGLILKDRYQSSRALQEFHGPVSVIMADQDTIIPPESTRRLFESYSGPKKLWRLPRSGHNELLWDISDADLRAAFKFASDE